MRVVKQAAVLRLCRAGQASGASLGSEVRLAQATSLNEDLDYNALLAVAARCTVRAMRRRYILAVLSVGSRSGFIRSGRPARVETIVASINGITSDVDGRVVRAARCGRGGSCSVTTT